MTNFHVSKQISAPLSKVWAIMSNIDNDPVYWHGTKSINNIRRSENTIEREVVIAFRNSVCKETVSLEPMKSIATTITDGPIKGRKTVTLHSVGEDNTIVDVEWDIKVKGVMSLFTGVVRKHILEGTEAALDRISRAI